MKPFQKILVPVDFSEHATAALEHATDLAKRYGASVSLIHVYEPLTYVLPDGYVLYTAEQLADLKTELNKRLQDSEKAIHAGGVTVGDVVIREGLPDEEVNGMAAKGNFDLIVMGTHGRSGFRHMMLGSVAEKVIRKAPCPVLVVHLPAK